MSNTAAKIDASKASTPTTIQGMLASPAVQKQLAMAIPKHLSSERLTRVAMTELRVNPGLMKCKPESLLGSIMKASALGLEVGSSIGEAYLVPYKTEATFIVGYKGLIKLVLQSGSVNTIQSHVVYENDHFELEYGLVERLVHRPALSNRGKMLGVYAIARMSAGGSTFEYMSDEEVQKIRNGSPGKNSDAWTKHGSEMARKTVLRRLCKILPLSPEAHTATSLDEEGERGAQTNADWLATTKDVTPEVAVKAVTEKPKAKSTRGAKPAPPPAQDSAQDLAPVTFAQVADMIKNSQSPEEGLAALKIARMAVPENQLQELIEINIQKWNDK